MPIFVVTAPSYLLCTAVVSISTRNCGFSTCSSSPSKRQSTLIRCFPVLSSGSVSFFDMSKVPLNAVLGDLRFHDLRHTWASWHRQMGTSCDELQELGGWKSRGMVDRYAKFATEHLAAAASRIESDRGGNVVTLSRFSHAENKAA